MLYLRRLIRDDALGLGFLFSTPRLPASHWSVFDSLSWAAQTVNSATEMVLMIIRELCDNMESSKKLSNENVSPNNDDSNFDMKESGSRTGNQHASTSDYMDKVKVHKKNSHAEQNKHKL